MAFTYLERTPPRADGGARRVQVATTELASRAGLLYRLGYTAAATTARLVAEVAWEFDPHRPTALSDQAIAKLVADTYARKPG